MQVGREWGHFLLMKLYTIPNCKNPFLKGEFESLSQLQSLCLNCGLEKQFIDNNIVEIDTDAESYILRNIPAEFHSALSYMAYEKGHAYGPSEIRLHLKELAGGLESSFEKYEKRIKESLT